MRISTTTLESFRLFLEPEQVWMSEDELIASIRGEFLPTPKVLRGSAFGSILETPDRYRVAGGYCCRDVAFGNDVMQPALDLIDYTNTVFEAKAVGVYHGHDVVAKADQLCGARLIETKTTESFDFEKYAASCQWRFMLDIFQAPLVTYHVFVLYESAQNGVIELKSIESFNLFPYAELHQDCCDLVQQFERYVDARGLRSVLDARQQAAA